MTCCCISYQQAIFKPTNRPKSCLICTSSELEFMEPVPVLKVSDRVETFVHCVGI